MPVTGRTGADAIFIALHKIVTVLAAYAPKFRAVVATMLAGGYISSAESAVILAFLDTLPALEAALKKVKDYSGIN
jgi:hypothetical protein